MIPEIEDLPAEEVTRLVFCSGKVYYDLLAARREQGIDHVAIIRLEQLYPFPVRRYAQFIEHYAEAREIVWCQEEPQNQGAWYQVRHRLQEPLASGHRLLYAGRKGAAAPAAGYYQLHLQQQSNLVQTALTGQEAVGRRSPRQKEIRKKA
jgi:2-oxoglutarate dehydrogenase E1 component